VDSNLVLIVCVSDFNSKILNTKTERADNDYTLVCSVLMFTGDLALLVDTSHPMIRPALEKGLDVARKTMQTGRGFCLQVQTH